MSVNKYIDIDSSFRNPFVYPEAGDFVARMNTTSQPGGVTAFNATSPISSSFPYDTGIPGDVVTEVSYLIYTVNYYFLRVPLSANSRRQANFYVGSYINFPYANPVNGPYGFTNQAYFLIVGYDSTPVFPLPPIAFCIPSSNITPIVAGTYATYVANYLPTIPLIPPIPPIVPTAQATLSALLFQPCSPLASPPP